jgi:trk system potassium uptake protein TrkH
MNKVLPITNVLGLMLMLFSLAFILPVGTSFWYQDGTAWEFLEAMIITLGGGYLMWLFTRRFKRELKARDGFLLVTLVWTVMAAFATIPLMGELRGLSFTDAYFETMSGLTTTGATTLTGLDTMPQAINMWRHELHWIGGMGIIVLAVAVLPLLGIGGRQLYKAETPGPMKDSQLTPRITETAKNLWLVYVGITVACILALKWAGMNWFDAICHAFSTLSLGGFSTHDASIGYYNSPLIEFVLIVFMLLAGMNFATHFLALRGRSFRSYLEDAEAKAYVLLMAVSCFGIGFYLWWMGTYANFWTALRHASFSVVSLASTTGFVTVDYSLWPIFAPLWMLFLSCVSVSSGSTGGGIKMIRTLLVFKQGWREMLLLIHPRAVVPVKVGDHAIANKVVFAVQGFIFLYFYSVVALTFLLLLSGMDFVSAFTAVIACINNAGPGLNQVGPATNYQSLTDFQIWVLSFTMLLGRLELFTLLVLFTPAFWRK